jgi:hypothetical protein
VASHLSGQTLAARTKKGMAANFRRSGMSAWNVLGLGWGVCGVWPGGCGNQTSRPPDQIRRLMSGIEWNGKVRVAAVPRRRGRRPCRRCPSGGSSA